ncbi:MAG: alpha/beta hydrolase [Chromatiales bacterium]|nr:alpha/beta hydrolase [Chromatiales bacterium]
MSGNDGALEPNLPDEIQRLESLCDRVSTPCGNGHMVWRAFGGGDRTIALFHGGSGSWWHWLRVIEPLAKDFRLLVADLPGLGDSDNAPEPYDAYTFGAVLAEGIKALTPVSNPPHMAGFSFGGVTGSHAAADLGEHARSMTVIGSGGMGLTRPPMRDFVRWRRLETVEERNAAHRHNLLTLMLANESSVDELAIYIQRENTIRARTKSGPASRTSSLCEALPRATCRIGGIWGELDATAIGHLEARRELFDEIQPGAPFHVIPGAGHWVAYEAPDLFVEALRACIAAYESER